MKCFFGGFLIFVVLLGLTCSIPGRNYFKAKKVSAAIAAQLPVGSAQPQVMAFLDEQGLDHSPYYVDDPVFPGRYINAIVRGTAWGFLCTADMEIKFNFDANDKLTKYEIDYSASGL